MKRIFCSLILAAISLPVCADMEVIPLHYRSVEEILPLVRPMLDADGAANGMDYQLIVRGSAANIAQIRQMVEALDRAPRRLQITVLQNVDGETMRRLTELSGSVGVGAGRAHIGAPGGADGKGLTIAAGQGNDQVRARIDSTRALSDDNKAQKIQVQEGKQALISVGQAVALPQRQIIQLPGRTQVIDSSQYRDVNSGFYVLPRVNGERVSLEISTQNNAIEAGNSAALPTLRTQQVVTTIYGRLGEWLVLGDVSQQGSEEQNTLSSHSISTRQERRNVLLKVEELN
ncbi:MAG TPA: secretin N-terminal domain-containing protein [Gallionellaceae bacterium]|nr:secretin N-terminal domain-containing protein [Gallionellaceae bacterium]